ncbi:MAG: hypothetical protein ABI743_09780 [bacterium]
MTLATSSRFWRGLAALCGWLLLMGAASAQTGTHYAVATPPGTAATGNEMTGQLMEEELAALQEVVVSGETLRYDETAGVAEWSGEVTLTAGSLHLTTDDLRLTFIPDPITTEPVIQTIAASPGIDLQVGQINTVHIVGGALAFDFTTRQGQIANAHLDFALTAETIEAYGEFPINPGAWRIGIDAELIRVENNDIYLERPDILVADIAGKDLRLAARELGLLNPDENTTILRTKNVRIGIDGHQLLKYPVKEDYTLRGRYKTRGYHGGLPLPVLAPEGFGLDADVRYQFGGTGIDPAPYAIGLHEEAIFEDHWYSEAYARYNNPVLGRFKLSWGTQRRTSPIPEDGSLAIRREPEFEWTSQELPLGDFATLHLAAGAGHITEAQSEREADRYRGSVQIDLDPIPLGNDHFFLIAGGELNQNWYDDEFTYRKGELHLGLRFYDPAVYGTELLYTKRDDVGFSPFYVDRFELREELSLQHRSLINEDWSGAVRMRYNLAGEEWEDIDLGVGHRFDLIEITAYWQFVQDGFRLSFGIPGDI